jgi:hypothetical protein
MSNTTQQQPTRAWVSLHGHRWGHAGLVYLPNRSQPKPWRVAFKRNRRSVHVGCFESRLKAVAAAQSFLAKERSSATNERIT